MAIIAANRVQYANATLYTLEALNEVRNPDGHIYSKDENVHRRNRLWAALIVAKFGVSRLKAAFRMDKTASENAENVFVVINRLDDAKFFDKCFEMAEYYNQDCFFFKAKDAEKPSDAICVGTNQSDKLGYNVKISCGEFCAQAVNDYLRRISDSSFGGSLPEIDSNSLFFNGKSQDCGFDGAAFARNHGVMGAVALNACGRNVWRDIEEHKYIYPDIQEFITREGPFRNILTFAVLANQKSSTAADGKKTLLDCVKARDYVCVPTDGCHSGHDGNLFIVINITFESAKKIAEEYDQHAFCFANVESGVIVYWALEKENKQFNWFSNHYIKKGEAAGFLWPEGSATDYAVECDSYKFALPTAAIADVSEKIQVNVDKYFKGNSAIVDWCIDHAGYEKYLRWKRLYKFD